MALCPFCIHQLIILVHAEPLEDRGHGNITSSHRLGFLGFFCFYFVFSNAPYSLYGRNTFFYLLIICSINGVFIRINFTELNPDINIKVMLLDMDLFLDNYFGNGINPFFWSSSYIKALRSWHCGYSICCISWVLIPNFRLVHPLLFWELRSVGNGWNMSMCSTSFHVSLCSECFPVLLFDLQFLGVSALPFSLLLSPNGHISWTKINKCTCPAILM